MGEHRTGCLVCGRDLVYLDRAEACTCSYCGEVAETRARCTAGHYVCDRCHALPALDLIERTCNAARSDDPLEIAIGLMHHPAVKMHGPEHHFLIPAVLLAAYATVTGDEVTRAERIRTARQRAESVKGGFCGFWGDCGAAVGTGIFISIVTGATPLSRREWRLANLATSRALRVIAEHGGPRCCKRNLYLAIREAVKFTAEYLGVQMKAPGTIRCRFSAANRECLREECPFHAG